MNNQPAVAGLCSWPRSLSEDSDYLLRVSWFNDFINSFTQDNYSFGTWICHLAITRRLAVRIALFVWRGALPVVQINLLPNNRWETRYSAYRVFPYLSYWPSEYFIFARNIFILPPSTVVLECNLWRESSFCSCRRDSKNDPDNMERAISKTTSLASLNKFEQFEGWLIKHGARLDSVRAGVRSDDVQFMQQVP